MNTDRSDRATGFDSAQEPPAASFRHTDHMQVQLHATVDGIQRHAPMTWQLSMDREREFYASFIGAGNGDFEIPLIQSLAARRGAVDGLLVYCSDISPTGRAEFLARARTAGVGTAVQQYEIVSFEDPGHRPQRADLLIAADVWHHIERWRDIPDIFNSLVKFQHSVRDRGAGLITLASKRCDRYRLAAHLAAIGLRTVPEPPGEAVAEECALLGLPYRTELVEAHTDLSACFDGEKFQPDQEGRQLLTFLLEVDWDELPEFAKNSVERKLLGITTGNRAATLIRRELYVWIFPDDRTAIAAESLR
ncbi:class I SAM-dependent methyltransferase [Nocardia colli]|uniref:Class I SAM-dependent methyltransferase n=1 Tax=Nocardia colli TaxID=2545717 RepID=A0A5N0DYU0_9NOCA|nr:class I SAM-dependent methyltransferase [Nocardia colli]KAA8881863.1 class I SAM-dependent methyltransferase [Nocardia colli]